MKTLYEYTAPPHEGGITVRMVQRRTASTPRLSYAVIVDVPGEAVHFDTFHDVEFAASSFVTLCDRFGGLPARQTPVMWP